jgi:hypothetical protein
MLWPLFMVIVLLLVILALACRRICAGNRRCQELERKLSGALDDNARLAWVVRRLHQEVQR